MNFRFHTLKFLLFVPGLTALFFPPAARAQEVNAPFGHWTAYVSHDYVAEIVKKGDILHVITQGGLFTQDVNTGETRSWSTVEGFSSITPTTMFYDSLSGYVFIGYQGGMINYFQTPEQVEYITDIDRTDQFTTKNIRKFYAKDGLLYIATDFGIVVYDITQKETRFSISKIGTNSSGVAVNDITIFNGRLYAAMESKGLYSVDLSAPNITVPTLWVKETDTVLNAVCNLVASTGDAIYAEGEDKILFRRAADTAWSLSSFPTADYEYLGSWKNTVFASWGNMAEVLYPDGTRVSATDWNNTECAFVEGNTIWMGDANNGLFRFRDGALDFVGPEGPNVNFVTEIAAGNGEVYWAPRGKKGSTDRFFDKSGINYFSFRGDGYKILDMYNGGLTFGRIAQDFARAYYHAPTGRAFLGSWSEGVLEMYKGDTVRAWPPLQSPIAYYAPDNSCRVGGIALDNDENLWVAIGLADLNLNVKTPDEQWYYYALPGAIPVGLLIDDYGNKWVNNQNAGLYVFNDNGTLDNKTDDDIRTLTSDPGNGGLPNNQVFSMEKDLDGAIWIGTSEGAVVFYDPGSVFYSGFQDATCPIIEGYCLLRDQKVNAIAVDGANRKWFGTDNGVYLISPDGTEQLQHYTFSNSPLFDNIIRDISIDQQTGEIFIGTDKGVLSLQGEAIEGRDTCGITVFPNPVYMDYTGSITIRGTASESRVKITTVSGMLVRELDSYGGQAIWDGKDTYGNPIVPGVYLVLTATKSGENACIGKVAVVHRKTN